VPADTYNVLTDDHLLYDLIYIPEQPYFEKGAEQGLLQKMDMNV